MRRGYQTQWAGQFGVAHELVRRGYLVTFTTGNAPGDDLLCLSPSGVAFSVQVKSLGTKAGFFFSKRLLVEPKPTRFFVLAFIPRDLSQPSEYFVMNNKQLIHLEAEMKKKGKRNPFKTIFTIDYHLVASPDFRNAWGNLPETSSKLTTSFVRS